MNVLTRAWDWLTEPLQTRALESFSVTLPDQIEAWHNRHAPSPWRPASIREALGVPAILRAVSLISNTTGSLAVRAYRNSVPLDEPPRIVSRPNPFSTPREFYRDSAYYLASRGEAVWWIAARDIDNLPASLIVVPLHELNIEKNPNDRRFPIYRWGKISSTAYSGAAPGGEFVHITYLREPGELRGMGPLQICGAAISVTVEAQQWAANFFAGDTSAVELQSLVDITADEAKALRDQWIEKGLSGLPRVTPPTLNWKEHQIDPESAQMVEARNHQDGEAARMFGIPGSLLEYSAPGSSLTYQNVEGEYTKFVRTCLAPNYLEPIEQAMSDLLPRSTVARFNVDGLLRADIKTRFEVYQLGVASGVLTPERAQVMEGLLPGDIEIRPVPFAQPSAVPASLPQMRAEELELATMQQREPAAMFAEALLAMANRPQVAPNVTVSPPSITIEAPPAQNITFEKGAFQVDAPPAAEVNVTTPDIHVDVAAADMSGMTEAIADLATRPQPAPEITVNTPEITVPPAQVNFAEGSIQSPDVIVHPANVTVTVPEQKAPVVNVSMPEPRKVKRTLTRDKNGRITGVAEE
jgi:HK97 family phage portal protein